VRPWQIGGMVVALVCVGAGCGEPTAQVVQAGDSRISFEIPIEFDDLSRDGDGGAILGPPGSSAVELSDEPVMFMLTSSAGDSASYQGLRQIATGGEFDPLDPELETLPDGTEVKDYEEINNPDVWGIRLRLVVGSGAKEFQALVHRESDQVVITEVTCTQACFVEHLDLIEQIQGSWSLEP
jgi:hypothetical protein